jgi:hypothetical protein
VAAGITLVAQTWHLSNAWTITEDEIGTETKNEIAEMGREEPWRQQYSIVTSSSKLDHTGDICL